MTRAPVSGCVPRGPHGAAARSALTSLFGVAAGTPEQPWMWLFWRDSLQLPWTGSQLMVELLALLSMLALVHGRCKRPAAASAGEENTQEYDLKKKGPESMQPDWDEASTVAGSPLSTVAGSPFRSPSTSTSLPPTPLFSRLPSPMEPLSEEMVYTEEEEAHCLPPSMDLPDDIASYGPLGCGFASRDLSSHCLPSPTGCGLISEDVA
eukprot:TRINITY_DN3740_c0_g1_i1.p1 TRINITY_DN3740_c0_g1~~TRINITY_DN3740_c0_g1_i1.p1  ORF type:complete len:226 (+),score=29.87 TRINITY_DN3740_c0_g1_i1:55-678(+)